MSFFTFDFFKINQETIQTEYNLDNILTILVDLKTIYQKIK